ncbi:ankyrin repeat domain-containing protein [Bacteroidota bacterium]
MKTIPKIFIVIVLILPFSNTKAQNGILKLVMDGDYDKVEQLISAEPDLVDTVIMYNTPLIIAAYFGKDKIAELLLNHGADMYKFKHKNGRTAIHLAAMQNHTSVVNVLIRKGVDVNFKDGSNKTALIYAIENKQRDLIDLLLLNGAKLPEEQELMNHCLHAAVLYSLQDIADELLENGASLSGLDNNGRSLLHNAVIGENIKWVELLCEKNIDSNTEDSFKRTPLHYSVESNQLEITKSLVKNGAEINSIDYTNRTPLTIAKGLGYVQIADFLEDNGGQLSDPKVFKIAGDKEEQQEVKVTYIANMGVLISSASKTVLIDGLVNGNYKCRVFGK